MVEDKTKNVNIKDTVLSHEEANQDHTGPAELSRHWAEEAEQERADYIEEQGIQIRY